MLCCRDCKTFSADLQHVCDTDNVLIYFERSISQIDLVASLPCLALPQSCNRERPYYSPTPGFAISINSINSCLDSLFPCQIVFVQYCLFSSVRLYSFWLHFVRSTWLLDYLDLLWMRFYSHLVVSYLKPPTAILNANLHLNSLPTSGGDCRSELQLKIECLDGKSIILVAVGLSSVVGQHAWQLSCRKRQHKRCSESSHSHHI